MKRRALLKHIGAAMLAVSMTVSMAACGGKDTGKEPEKTGNETSQNGSTAGEEDGPLSPYKEEITITMGRQTLQNPKLPDGDTYEDNAYTRWVKSVLNIKIVDEFEANGDDYNRLVSLALSAAELPDMMKVSTLDELRELYKNDLIEDLTEVYNTYASDYLKKVYDSYDGRALKNVTFDGKIMALPGTNGDPGPSEVWIRSDWAEKLGLKIDEDGDKCITISELEAIAKEFMAKNPGNADNVVGMAFAPWLTSSDPDGTYSINSIAYAYGAYPKTWLNVDGKVVYGSTTQETKEAMKKVAEWFKSGLVDPQLGVRTWDDITALLANGQTGITFGTWHIPDWLLSNVRAIDSKATFECYAIEDSNGKVNVKHNDATGGYIVVRKGYEHPEAAIKIANLFYDVMMNSKTLETDYPEVAKYLKDGVDGSVRPFNIEVNPYTSMLDDYSDIERGVKGEIAIEDVRTTESKNVIQNVKNYMADPAKADVTDWSKFHSRMKGIELIQTLTEKGTFNWLTPVFPQTTPTMETNWGNLGKLEEEIFIKMAIGAVDVEEGFNKFVKDWYSMGGEQIIAEIEEQLK
ncbi:sugar ABC transporter substrate-binding protein [Clostridium thermarum]|uniref:sugar ABC transporter substrate-binding protein n=1 Tax=Clostridium thermarum TaxID=1716543 RepID=UPI0013D7DF10|nr:sugar ABC transporter substrate-binding protein [Clostridium thermarum]